MGIIAINFNDFCCLSDRAFVDDYMHDRVNDQRMNDDEINDKMA